MSTKVLKLSKDQRVEFEGRQGFIESNEDTYKVIFDEASGKKAKKKKGKPTVVRFGSDIRIPPGVKLLPPVVSDDFSDFFNEYVVLVLSHRLALSQPSSTHAQLIRR